MRTILKTAKYYWRVHLIVALCTAVATGVLAGALIVGDSMRGSLRNIAFERLGKIQHAVIADHFFHPDIIKLQNMEAAILLNGTVVAADTDARASKVNIYGVAESFFDFWAESSITSLNKQETPPFANIVINHALQKELNVQVGDAILVNFPKAAEIHPEFLLGTRDTEDIIQSLRVIVSDIISTQNSGRFSIHPHQSLPLNAYLSRSVLQKTLGQSGKINAMFTADTEPTSADSLALTFDALGLKMKSDETHFDLQSEKYLIEPKLSEIARTVASKHGIPTLPTFTYLANTITSTENRNDDQRVPYSTVLAIPIDSQKLGAPFDKYSTEQINDHDIFLNKWAADDLGIKEGAKINITYFNVSAEEEYLTKSASFTLKGIVPIVGIAADTNLIPAFPGIHDTAGLSDWDPPFPFDYSQVRDKDEAYWDEYKATPKAFIPLRTGQNLWKNRFGDLTSIRMGAAPGLDIDATKSLFESEFLQMIKPEEIGYQFLSLQAEGLQSAKGSTDFSLLFSSLSFFIIYAAATLVSLIFAIGVSQRSREIGILHAVGYRLRKIRRHFLLEGITIAFIGSILGCLLAIGYAQLMIYGLKTWWLPAIGTPFIDLYVSGWSLLIGIGVTLVIVVFFMGHTVKRLGKISTAVLLTGETDFDEVSRKAKPQHLQTEIQKKTSLYLGIVFGIIAGYFLCAESWIGFISILIVSFLIFFIFRSRLGSLLMTRLNPSMYQHQGNREFKLQLAGRSALLGFGIGAIVGFIGTTLVFSYSGSHVHETIKAVFNHPVTRLLGSAIAILGVGTILFDRWLGSQRIPKHLNRLRFGLKNAAWQPMHSSGSVLIMSLACCIIVAVGANRHDALPETEYTFVAESSLPIHHNINSPEGRLELGFNEEDVALIAKSKIFPFRVLPGEDVSCLNLYKPEKPQILGAPDSMLNKDPWRSLSLENPQENRLDAIGDENSLRWILKHNPEDDFIIQDEKGNSLFLKLHTIKNSIFQSQLIISESNFTKHFPSQSGYQFFLFITPPEIQEQTQQVLETTLEKYGYDVTSAPERLASFRAVENTYISTFQSLGGLGVLLGTIGISLVLFRNIIERRVQLATLRAFGFRMRLLFKMLLLESCFILTVGMLIGIAAGLVAAISSQGHVPAFPWISLTITLLLIFVFGIISNYIAVSVALRSPLLSTLKSE